MTAIDEKPKKKKRWYYGIIYAVMMLWLLGGLEVFLLRDIPFLAVFGITAAALYLPYLPIAKRVGKNHSRWFDGIWRFAVLTTLLVVLLFVIPPFSISRQTTYLTEPRSKEFCGIDYQTAIEQRIEPTAHFGV